MTNGGVLKYVEVRKGASNEAILLKATWHHLRKMEKSIVSTMLMMILVVRGK